MKKELLISAKFDTTDFDKSVESMQKKLKEMYAPSDAIRMQRTSQMLQQANFGPLAGAPGGRDTQSKINEYRRNLDTMIKAEKTTLEDKIKNLAKEEASYKKISEEYQKVVKAGQEDLKLKKELQQAQEALTKAKEEELKSETEINAMLKERERSSVGGRLMEGYKTGGVRGAASAGGEMMGMGATGAAAMGALAAYAALLAKGLFQDFVSRPLTVISAQGAAMAGTMGRSLSEHATGQSVFEGMFSEERQRAMDRAESATRRRKFADIFSLGIFGEGGERLRASIFDPEKANALYGKYKTEAFTQAESGEKEMSPFKKLGIEKLQRDMYKDISTQRQLGLDDQDMFGKSGFLQRSLDAGFMEDMAREAAKGIASAGGSTAMQRSAVAALQAERGLNVTNATQMFGQLSGGMGTAETSKQALIDIFAEGQARGLDKSKYAEENRKFMQNVADVVSRGSMSSDIGAKAIAEEMGGFTTGTKTIKGLENARAAYEAYQETTSATAGFTGAVNTATLMKQFPDLVRGMGKDPAMLQQLMSMKQEYMDPNSPIVKSMVESYNKNNPDQPAISAEQFLQRREQARAATAQADVGVLGAGDEARKLSMDMIKYAEAHGGSLDGYQPTGDAQTGFAKLTSRIAQFNPQMTPPQLAQYALGQAAQGAEAMPEGAKMRAQLEDYRKKQQEDAGKAMEATGPRKIDDVLATSAKDAKVAVEELSGSLKSLADAAKDAHDKFASSSVQFRQLEQLHADAIKRGDTNKAAYIANAEAQMAANITAHNPDIWAGIPGGQRKILEQMMQTQASAGVK